MIAEFVGFDQRLTDRFISKSLFYKDCNEFTGTRRNPVRRTPSPPVIKEPLNLFRGSLFLGRLAHWLFLIIGGSGHSSDSVDHPVPTTLGQDPHAVILGSSPLSGDLGIYRCFSHCGSTEESSPGARLAIAKFLPSSLPESTWPAGSQQRTANTWRRRSIRCVKRKRGRAASCASHFLVDDAPHPVLTSSRVFPWRALSGR